MLRARAAADVIIHFDAPSALGHTKNAGTFETRRQIVTEHLTRRLDEVVQLVPEGLSLTRSFVLQTAAAATVTRDALPALLASDHTRYVELDARWPVHTQEGLEVIRAGFLHSFGITGDDTAVAIVDTGVDYLHPVLGGGEIPNAKVVVGLDTADNDDDPMDCSGHGTAVASVAAGASYQWNPINEFAGGVAPEARVFAYKASRDDACDALVTSAVVAAIEHAVLHREGEGYRLAAINISAGAGSYLGPCDSAFSAYATAVDQATAAGVAVVASAGNEGQVGALNAPACLSKVLSVGSIWDSAPGFTGFSFCLDETCSTTCDDSYRPAYSLSCYSNRSPYLDVLAPSEYLQVALAGGQTGSFGGTSGAAPYVTGAIALMRDAYPNLDPIHAQLLLATSGRPVRDWQSDLEIPLIDVSAALDRSGIALAAETVRALPGPGEEALESAVWVNDTGTVAQVEAVVRLVHPDPRHLRLRLTAPDGTSVVLHDRSAGTTVNPNNQSRFGAVFAHYPEPDAPAESLIRFAGRGLRGSWILEVENLEQSQTGSAGGTLLGWALRFRVMEAPGAASSHTQFIPITARSSGVNETTWISDLHVFNPSPVFARDLRLYLVRSGIDGSEHFFQHDIRLAAFTELTLADYLGALFGFEEFQGQLLIESDEPVLANARIFNSAATGGSYGQFIASTGQGASLAAGEAPVFLLQLARSEGYRTNLGFSEIAGSRAWVEVELYDAHGDQLAKSDLQIVEPYSNLQINQVFKQLGVAECANCVAEVAVVAGSGRVNAYASVVDNLTGDAIYVPGARPQDKPGWVIPVVARSSGSAGTNWASDVRILNLGSQGSLRVSFTPRQESGGSPAERQLNIGYREVLALDDVVGTLFDLHEASGSLHIQATEEAGALLVSSRTYNRTTFGTYGQYIPAVVEGFEQEAMINHLVKSSHFRTNVGVCEVSGGHVAVELELFDAAGRAVGAPLTVGVGPWELLQLNDVFKAVGAPALDDAWLRVTRRTGAGRFAAYASIVDSSTGDAVFVPALSSP